MGERMKSEDEIMAGHLLKGGKMLSTSCPACGCPLFEVKGETLCVVCAEKNSKESNNQPAPRETEKSPTDSLGRSEKPEPSSRLVQSLEETVIALCARVREEEDPRCVVALMEAVTMGIEVLSTLRSR
jgi:UPF0148 protein